MPYVRRHADGRIESLPRHTIDGGEFGNSADEVVLSTAPGIRSVDRRRRHGRDQHHDAACTSVHAQPSDSGWGG